MHPNKIIALLAVVLSGCTTYVPVRTPFPEAPAALMDRCGPLVRVPDNAQMSDIVNVVVGNYSQYHACAALEAGWVDWYTAQHNMSQEKTHLK